MEIVRGGTKTVHRHTHTYRHTHTHTLTQTHTHAEAHFISLVFLRKCRNKTKNGLDCTLVTCLPMGPRIAGSNPTDTAIF